MKQDIGTLKLNSKIITPFHIDNNEVYDRLDYFVFKGRYVVQIVDRKWLYDCADKDKKLFSNIIESLEEGNFENLEAYKAEYYEKYFSSDKFLIEEISVGNEALKFLLQNKDYSNRKDIKGNLGEIKKFTRLGKSNEITIPGSTLKGIFRTIYLQELLEGKLNKNQDYIKIAEELKELNNRLNKDFAYLFFEDVKVKNPKVEIQQISLNTSEKSSIPVVVETLTNGKFEIVLKYDKNNENIKNFIENMKTYLKDYSTLVICREEKIFDNFNNFDAEILDILDSELNQGKYPIKIGMFKKSLTYKLFWDEELEDIYEKLLDLLKKFKKGQYIDFEKEFNELKLGKFGFKNVDEFKKLLLKNKNKKPTLAVGQILGLGNKSFYIDENQNPIGWISLEIKN